MKALGTLFLSLILILSSLAQSPTREIAGTVTDTNHKFIDNLKVKVINWATKKTYKTKTNKSGFYRFKNLPLGNYTLTFEGRKEFRAKTIENIEIGLNGGVMYNLSLESQ